MHIIVLKFAENRAEAATHLAGHKAWLDSGRKAGVFLMWGTLAPNLGGAILAKGASRGAIESRVAEDPFVRERIVTAEILDLTPAFAVDDLAFLRAEDGAG